MRLLLTQQRFHAFHFFSRNIDHILEQSIANLEASAPLDRAIDLPALQHLDRVFKIGLAGADARASLLTSKSGATQLEADPKFLKLYDLEKASSTTDFPPRSCRLELNCWQNVFIRALPFRSDTLSLLSSSECEQQDSHGQFLTPP